MHSVGSIPHGNSIDVPLNYADYYFLEALIRKRNIEAGLPPCGISGTSDIIPLRRDISSAPE